MHQCLGLIFMSRPSLANLSLQQDGEVGSMIREGVSLQVFWITFFTSDQTFPSRKKNRIAQHRSG
jgi:hypothetical protein